MQKQKKCDKWKDYIGIKNSIVFCSALGGVLGALVGIPVGGAICGGVMGTNAQDGLRSLVDWFVGPSGEETKKYNFYKKYEEKYLEYAKDHANNNNVNVDFKHSKDRLLSGIQTEIGKCYEKYCNSNNDETNIDIDEIISENIKIEHPVLENLPERTFLDKIGDTCKDAIKVIGDAFFGTGNKGRVVKRVEEIAPNKHISTDMDSEGIELMHALYKKIKYQRKIEINFVNKCSREQSNENSNFQSDKLYLSRDMFGKVYKLFTNRKFEKEKMPTEDNLKLFYETYKLLFGDLRNQSFLKDFSNRRNFSLEEDTFSLKEMPPMKWQVKKMMVNGKQCSTKDDVPCITKTLEYFFADISKHIQENQDKCLKGNTKLQTNADINGPYDKTKKQSNNLDSSLNTSTTSRGSSDSYETCFF